MARIMRVFLSLEAFDAKAITPLGAVEALDTTKVGILDKFITTFTKWPPTSNYIVESHDVHELQVFTISSAKLLKQIRTPQFLIAFFPHELQEFMEAHFVIKIAIHFVEKLLSLLLDIIGGNRKIGFCNFVQFLHIEQFNLIQTPKYMV